MQTDQRGEGFGRVVTTTASFSGDGTDIGAFELEVRIFSDGLEAL